MTVAVKEKPKLQFADDADNMKDWQVREGLGWRLRRDAEIMRTISRGTMLVHGDRGSGKDLFAVSVAYMNKFYFGRPVLLDFMPKRTFGKYTPFNAKVMMGEIRKMAKAAGVEGIENTQDQEEYDQFVEEETVKWATEGRGLTLLKYAVIYLSELKRYAYNRNPHNKFNKFIGSLNSIIRHLDGLIMGTHVFPNEIDEKTYMQYANIRAKCEWSINEPHTTRVKISMRGMIGADFAYGQNVIFKPFYYTVNGNEPRSYIGFDADDSEGPIGNRHYDLWKSKNDVDLIPVPPKGV